MLRYSPGVVEPLVLLLVLIPACGETGAGTAAGSICEPDPSVEPTDCVLGQEPEGGGDLPKVAHIDSKQKVREVCQSPCRKAESLDLSVPGLENLKAFSRLDQVEALRVANNPDLKSLDGFEADVSYGINIQKNSNLRSLDSLNSVKGDLKRISVVRNPELNSLDGLQNIDRLTGTSGLVIERNGLSDLSALESVSFGEIKAIIRHENRLNSLEGLGELGRLYTLRVSSNDNLENLDGLESLTNVTSTLAIEDNQNLPTCLPESLVERIDVEGADVQTSGNAGYDFPECDQ